LAEFSGPVLDRQLNIIRSLNKTLSRLGRTAIIILGIILSGVSLANQGVIPEFATLEIAALLLSVACLVFAAVIGFMTQDYAAGIGLSDKLYRDAIEEEYTKQELDGRIALFSGSHMGNNIATIEILAGRVQFVQMFLAAGVLLLGFTAVLVLLPQTPLAVVVAVVESAVIGVILYKWNRELEEKRESIRASEFPEFAKSG